MVVLMLKFFNDLLEKIESWGRKHDQRALEYYLSKSQNITDLENRMRLWQYSDCQKRMFL